MRHVNGPDSQQEHGIRLLRSADVYNKGQEETWAGQTQEFKVFRRYMIKLRADQHYRLAASALLITTRNPRNAR